MTPQEIWGGNSVDGRQADLFGRREEAEQLIAYLESVVGRQTFREDKRAFTIAIDGRYGEGKTFFLRRFAEHLGLNHPVAFIDAWADDLADEPLTALAATLKLALEPFEASPAVKSRVSTFMAMTGTVVKAVGLGALRKGASMVITGKAVEALEDAFLGLPDEAKAALSDSAKDASDGVVNDAVRAALEANAKPMEQRIEAFELGRGVIRQMKASLSAIIDGIRESDSELVPPIFIVIDELDRCRPTYAVKLLEEIKHLFDVPGLVFVLGMNSEQLSHSVSGAYGAGFDGGAYLKRFVDREYRLAEPSLTALLERLCDASGVNADAFSIPDIHRKSGDSIRLSLPEILAEYMRIYGLTARDSFNLVDRLQTSIALMRGQPLHAAYFIPLAIGAVKGLPISALTEKTEKSDWVFAPNWSNRTLDSTLFSLPELALAIHKACLMADDEFELAAQQKPHDYVIALARRTHQHHRGPLPLSSVYNYPKLLGAVARFTNPSLSD